MAKVVLIWNEHPTEVLGGVHARQVGKILREKYGHEVKLHKIPPKDTNYITSNLPVKETVLKLARIPDSIDIAKKIAEEQNAWAFNFHSSEPDVLGKSSELPANKFRLRWGSAKPKEFKTEILIGGKKSDKHFVIEVPAEMEAISLKRKGEYFPDFLNLWNAIPRVLQDFPIQYHKKVRHYLLDEAKSYQLQANKLKINKKYSDVTISEKIAAAIHRKITKQKTT